MPPTSTPQSTLPVTIKRHPFGIVALYLQAIVGFAASLGLIFFLIPSLLGGESQDKAIFWLSIFAITAVSITAIFLLLATYIYRNNKWIVTKDNILQVAQTGLFRKQTSELSMANIEDVSAEQLGILATMFGFGTLKAQTAGENSNFTFIYCPNPNKYAAIILDARESFIHNDPAVAKRANELLNVPRG